MYWNAINSPKTTVSTSVLENMYTLSVYFRIYFTFKTFFYYASLQTYIKAESII